MAKLPRSIAIQLQSFQPAVSEYFLQPEELQLRQRMRGLKKLQEPYRPELTRCSCASGPVLDLVARERLPACSTLRASLPIHNATSVFARPSCPKIRQCFRRVYPKASRTRT